MSLLPWPLGGLIWPRRRRRNEVDRPRREDERRAGKGAAPTADPAGAALDSDAASDARFGGDEEPESDWVTVYAAPALEIAHVIRTRLESEGLPVVLRYDTYAVVLGMTAGFGVRVLVPRALEDRARAILAADPVPEDPDDDHLDPLSGEAEDGPGDLA